MSLMLYLIVILILVSLFLVKLDDITVPLFSYSTILAMINNHLRFRAQNIEL